MTKQQWLDEFDRRFHPTIRGEEIKAFIGEVIEAQEERRRTLVDKIRLCIMNEPELPGDMPDSLWLSIKDDRELCVMSHQLAVKGTKNNIWNAIKSVLEGEDRIDDENKVGENA